MSGSAKIRPPTGQFPHPPAEVDLDQPTMLDARQAARLDDGTDPAGDLDGKFDRTVLGYSDLEPTTSRVTAQQPRVSAPIPAQPPVTNHGVAPRPSAPIATTAPGFGQSPVRPSASTPVAAPQPASRMSTPLVADHFAPGEAPTRISSPVAVPQLAGSQVSVPRTDTQPMPMRGSAAAMTVPPQPAPQPMPIPQQMRPSSPVSVTAPPARFGTPQIEIERYEIGRTIGVGTFGQVFEARDRKLGRKVALKVLHGEHTSNVELRQRFLQEAHAAACIGHPGIITVFDAGESERGDSVYIAMELLAGEPLDARLKRIGRLDSMTVLEVGRQAASALYAAHGAGVIHRDLKPENLFLVPDPAVAAGERVKVLDFGLAKPTQSAVVMTKVAMVLGTPGYMSPEQCLARELDHRSDIYSLGCVLYHLAAGRPPFDGSLPQVIGGHTQVTPPRLAGLVPDIAPELDALVTHMLAKAPVDRPQTMQIVAQACRIAPPPPAPPKKRKRFLFF